MKNYRKITVQVVSFLLIILWIYAASSKLMNFNMFRQQMSWQMLFPFIKHTIIYILPAAEVLTAFLLVFERTQRAGLYFSFTMLLAFTIYVGLAVFKFFDHIPCSCGGILNKMTWNAHFLLNIFFLLLTALGIYMVYRERGSKRR